MGRVAGPESLRVAPRAVKADNINVVHIMGFMAEIRMSVALKM